MKQKPYKKRCQAIKKYIEDVPENKPKQVVLERIHNIASGIYDVTFNQIKKDIKIKKK